MRLSARGTVKDPVFIDWGEILVPASDNRMTPPGGTRRCTVKVVNLEGFIMKKAFNLLGNFERVSVRCQAIHRPLFKVLVRRLCYVLAQKGDPTL